MNTAIQEHKLMVAGPTEIEAEVREAGSWRMVYNRTPEFSEFINALQSKLKRVFRTDNQVYLLSSSGTGAMEAAFVNVMSRGDEAVVLNGGTFGRRWYEIAQEYGIACDVVEVAKGESIDPALLHSHVSAQTKAVFVTANETSTGVTIDLESIGGYVRQTEAILVVDAVSSLASDMIETARWGVDVVITSSQKALALPPGLALITLSEKAWEAQERSNLPKYYFDLARYREDMKRGQTPFTPPISLLYQLDVRLDKILEKGVENVVKEQHRKSEYLKGCVASIGLRVIGERPSNGVIGLMFPEHVDAYETVVTLRDKYGIEITPSPGEDKHRIARVGTFGDVSMHDVDRLTDALKEILENQR